MKSIGAFVVRAKYLVLFLALGLSATPAFATDFGVRGGVYTQRDRPFLGAELLVPAGGDIYFNPNAEYVFLKSGEGQLWTFNFDGHWDLPTHARPYVWIGGGLAVLYAKQAGVSDTRAHANLLAGIGFRTESHVVPYIQVKLITESPTELVAAGGIRF
jgi:hypothetical protein